MAFLETRALTKTFPQGDHQVHALRGVDLTIQKGQFISIMGPSGSGKSTLLHLLGGLDRPSSGQILFEGQAVDSYSDRELSLFRRRRLGFVFQFFNLLPTLSAIENVSLPLLLDGQSANSIEPRARALLAQMKLEHRAHHRPDQLSGGEMQRVALARALITHPLLILADEPTGNLDSQTGASVLELLSNLAMQEQQTIVMVTHDAQAASYGNRLIRIRDGRIESDTLTSRKTDPSCVNSSASLP